MKWSLRAGKVLGIDVNLHFTFLLLLAFLGWSAWHTTGSYDAALRSVAFVAALFGCVLLHELGHALAARRYGIGTIDITLLPIGGIARLERMPGKPSQELFVALAGPAVNLALAAALFIGLLTFDGLTAGETLSFESGTFFHRLFAANLALAAFNLLPAFPMDGGRVLRAALTASLGRRRATIVATNVGQGIAIVLGVVGFLGSPFLVFLAILVFLGAQAEAGLVEMQSALKGLRVRDAMMTRFRTLDPADSLGRAVDELLAGAQQDFPVIVNDRAVGMLRRNDLVKALTEHRADAAVSSVMDQACEPVDDAASLRRTVAAMQTQSCASVTVVREGKIVGLLTMEHVTETIMLNAARESRGGLRQTYTPAHRVPGHPSVPAHLRRSLP